MKYHFIILGSMILSLSAISSFGEETDHLDSKTGNTHIEQKSTSQAQTQVEEELAYKKEYRPEKLRQEAKKAEGHVKYSEKNEKEKENHDNFRTAWQGFYK